MAAIVSIVSRRSLRIETHRRNQPNKSKLALYKPLLHFYSYLKQLYMNNKMERSVTKVGVTCVGLHMSRYFKKADLGYR